MKRIMLTLAISGTIFATLSYGKPEIRTSVPSYPSITEETVSYSADGVTMKGFVAYDPSIKTKLPVVLVVHEWWGLNDYAKMRARELAKLGYLAFAVDLYGDGKIAENPTDAQALATPFYMNPQLGKGRFDAALAKIKTYPQADVARVAAIGYCFGGGQVLNVARMGEDLKGVVSFHGNLTGTAPDKSLLKAKVLVCHGADDKFVLPAEVDKFRKQMDSVGADYSVKVYPNATHAFTNPNSTAVGQKFNMPIAYNAEADAASWKEMQTFLTAVFKK